MPVISTTRDLGLEFGRAFPAYAKEVFLALLPVLVFFFLFQLAFLKLRKKQLVKVLAGILYTFIGLLLFLTGVNVALCRSEAIWAKSSSRSHTVGFWCRSVWSLASLL